MFSRIYRARISLEMTRCYPPHYCCTSWQTFHHRSSLHRFIPSSSRQHRQNRESQHWRLPTALAAPQIDASQITLRLPPTALSISTSPLDLPDPPTASPGTARSHHEDVTTCTRDRDRAIPYLGSRSTGGRSNVYEAREESACCDVAE